MANTQAEVRRTMLEFAEAVRSDGRYPLAAFEFVQHGIEYTTRRVHVDGRTAESGPRHVSGAQLCEGLRALARELWGPLAQSVLHSWGVRRTRDFGEMVFLMVSVGLLGKQESDRIEDFDGVYEFDAAFADYRVTLEAFDRGDSGAEADEDDDGDADDPAATQDP